jgi:hypothetical protein
MTGSDGRIPPSLRLFLFSCKLKGWTAPSLWRGRRAMTLRHRSSIANPGRFGRPNDPTPAGIHVNRTIQPTTEPGPPQADWPGRGLMAVQTRPSRLERTPVIEKPNGPKTRRKPRDFDDSQRQANPTPLAVGYTTPGLPRPFRSTATHICVTHAWLRDAAFAVHELAGGRGPGLARTTGRRCQGHL